MNEKDKETINGIREEIDKTDEEIFALLSKRFELSKKIGDAKRDGSVAVADRKREEAILARAQSAAGKYAYQVKIIYENIFPLSRELQLATGLVGENIECSLSPRIHALLGDPFYSLYKLSPCEAPAFFEAPVFDAINVTMPYKRLAASYCASLSAEAKAAGCVNVIMNNHDGTLSGYNTDLFGFGYTLDRMGADVKGKKVLLVGNGGAAGAIRAVTGDRRGEAVTVSRSIGKGLCEIGRNTDAAFIVNATPSADLPIDLRAFDALEGVIDITYMRKSKLVSDAQALGVNCCDGIPMLVAQAAASRAIFTQTDSVDFDEIERIIAILSEK